MNTLIQTDESTKILRNIQYRIAQKLSIEENILKLLPSLDVAACLYLLQQTDISITTQYLYR